MQGCCISERGKAVKSTTRTAKDGSVYTFNTTGKAALAAVATTK